MAVSPPSREIPEIEVTLDHLAYHYEAEKAPPETPHLFIYFLTIANRSPHTVTLMARKWVVTMEDGTRQVIEGDKIVGETPTLGPWEQFSYNSFHLIGQNAEAEGAFFGLDENGRRIHTKIPRFELIIPPPAHEHH